MEAVRSDRGIGAGILVRPSATRLSGDARREGPRDSEEENADGLARRGAGGATVPFDIVVLRSLARYRVPMLAAYPLSKSVDVDRLWVVLPLDFLCTRRGGSCPSRSVS